MNTAVIITGTMCSGKSTISERIQKELNIKLITESNVSPKNFLGMMYEIKNNEFKDIVLIEHAEILRKIDEINKYFENIVIVLINVSNSILIDNFKKRELENTIGSYSIETVLAWKKYIEDDFNKVKNNYINYIVDINANDDYDSAHNNIIKFLSMYKIGKPSHQ